MSVQRSEGRLSIVISGKVEPWKEALLFAWVFAWTACGIYFVYTFLNATDRDMKLSLMVMLAFWAYFEMRIGKALLWRKFGRELIRIKDGALSIKNDIKGYGKAQTHFVQNIENLELIDLDGSSFKWQMTSSFWVVGAQKLTFRSMGKNYLFGKGLDDIEARELLKILKKEISAQRKSTTAE